MLRRNDGFTLVETLAALLIFSIVTIGVLPLLASSLRGATVARSYTIGRNLAQQAMERVRGLPYHVGFNTEATRVDILDLYYPTAQTSGISTTVCDATTTANPACPRNLADDYTVTFEAAFVNPSIPETILTAGPPGPNTYTTSYAWDSSADAPPSQLLRMTITSSWDVGGTARDYSLQSFISDRRFGDLKFSGTSTVDFAVHVTGSFFEGTQQGDLIAQVGTGESTIESKLQSSAVQTVSAGSLNLLAPDGPELDEPAIGQEATLRVPPQESVDPGTDLIGISGQIDLGTRTLAAVGPNPLEDVKAGVVAELPYASGEFTDSADPLDFWVAEQDPAELASGPLGLDPAGHFLEVLGHAGATSASATSLGSGSPGTTTASEMSVDEVRLFPLNDTRIGIRTYGGAVAVVRGFASEVNCSSTGTLSAGAQADWGATLTYWNDPEDGVSGNGSYVDVPLSGSLAGDPLATLKQTNPLVWEAPDADPGEPEDLDVPEDPDGSDIYLFEDPTSTPARIGYFQDWSSSFDVSVTGVVEGPTGEETSAKIPGAIRMQTVAPDPAASTGLSIQISSLSCRAVEFRL